MRKISKPALISLAIFGVVLLGVAGYFIYAHIQGAKTDDRQTSNQASTTTREPQQAICSDEIITRANTALAGGDLADLEAVNSLVQQTPEYQKDQNCLYIVVRYYLERSAAVPAREQFSVLEKTFDGQKGFSPLFAPMLSIATLKERLEFVEQNDAKMKEQSQQNYNYLDDVDRNNGVDVE